MQLEARSAETDLSRHSFLWTRPTTWLVDSSNVGKFKLGVALMLIRSAVSYARGEMAYEFEPGLLQRISPQEKKEPNELLFAVGSSKRSPVGFAECSTWSGSDPLVLCPGQHLPSGSSLLISSIEIFMRGHGVGSKLLADLKDMGFDSIALMSVGPRSTNFYLKNGFHLATDRSREQGWGRMEWHRASDS